jgi:DNA gyrase/topoisomerase IV subunit A
MAQQGTVFERNGSWYLQYWRTDFKGGQNVRRRVTEKLVRRDNQYRSRKDVLTGCAKQINNILEPINTRRHQPEGNRTLAEFTEERFLPHIQEKISLGYKKPSTLKFYKDVFNNHLKNTVGNISLRDFTTLDAQNLLDQIDKTKDLSHKSLQRIQNRLERDFHFRQAAKYRPVEPGPRREG